MFAAKRVHQPIRVRAAAAKTTDWYRRFAATLVDNDYSVVAILPKTKKPRHPRWQTACFKPTDPEYLAKHCEAYPQDSVGIACGRNVVAIDIDADDLAMANELHRLARDHLGDTPLIRIGRSPRRTLMYRLLSPMNTQHGAKLDLIAQGGCFVAYGVHPEGQPYWWPDADPAETAAEKLPPVGAPDVQRFMIEASRLVGGPVHRYPNPANDNIVRPPRRAIAAGSSELMARVTRDLQNLVVDGREAFLTLVVYEAFRSGAPDAESIAHRAWVRFAAEADLQRPKGSGGRKRWAFKDALLKARAILRKHRQGIVRCGPRRNPSSHVHSARRSGYWTPERKRQHQAEAALRLRTPYVLAVNSAMLDSIDLGSGMVSATVSQISARTNLSISGVKQARRKLIELGLWLVERGVYVPVPIDQD